MTDLGVARWIRELDQNGAVSLARALALAEASRLGVPVGSVSMSGRVTVGDEGVDGRT